MRVAHPFACVVRHLRTARSVARSRRFVPVAVSCVPILCIPASGRAQGRAVSAIGQQIGQTVSVGVDAGAATVTYDDYGTARVASVSPTVRWETARSMVLATASLSEFETGHTSFQSGVTGSLLSPELWKVRGEFSGTFSTTRYIKSLAATNLYGVGRLHASGQDGGAWIGAGGGFVSQGSRLPDAITQFDAGVWARDEDLLYTLTVLPTHVGAARYADVTGAVHWDASRAQVAAVAGYRARPTADIPGVQAWAEGWLTVWFGRRVAAVVGAGVFPFDVVQQLPGGRYASLGLRLVTRRSAAGDPARRAELTELYDMRRLARNARAHDAVRFQIIDADDGTRVLRLLVPGARRVELMADFTDWAPIALTQLSPAGEWAAALVISPGVHRVNVRVDDGDWVVPPGLTAVRDEFGSASGVFVLVR